MILSRKNQKKPKALTFNDHLQELRFRLLACVLFIFIGFLIGVTAHDQIISVLLRPLQQPLFYSSPSGGLDFILQTSFFFGTLFSLPVFVYHGIKFVEPAFSQKLPHSLWLTVLASFLLLLSGIAFAYFVSLPAALHFLTSFTSGEIRPLISTTEYFTFVSRYLFGFGVIFQLPLFLLVFNSLHKVSFIQLLHWERWVILLSFVIAAILTPTPDIANQMLMALPIIVLYQVCILAIWFVNRLDPKPGSD